MTARPTAFFKRTTAQGFYRFLSAMGAEIVYNHADYRLISARALHELAKFKEVNLFLRGMVPLVGFKSTSVEYKRGRAHRRKKASTLCARCSRLPATG